jgi:plastocyanin
MKSLRVVTVLLVVLLLGVAVGCGGGDGDNGGGNATETATTPTTEGAGAEEAAGTAVKMDEYSFDPDTLTVDKGATLTVENAGNIAHNLTIERGPDPKEKSTKLAGTPSFLGGKSEDLTVDLDPGKYAMVCTVSGHRELGMTGTITVK